MMSAKKDYLWNTIGAFLQSAISPALLVLITRLNGLEDSGTFSFAFSVAIVLWALGMWGGRTYQVSDVKREFSNAGYITARFITSAIMLLLATGFCVLNGYDINKSGVILLLVVFKAVESISDAIYGVLQSRDKLYMAGVSLTVKAITGLVSFVAVDLITGSIVLGVSALIVAHLLMVLIYDLPQMRKIDNMQLGDTFRGDYIKQALEIMKQSWAVFIIIFLTMFTLNIPRYFLDIYHEEQIGYFGIMAMPITLLALMVSFIIQPNILRMSNLFSKGLLEEFKTIVRQLILLTLGLGGFVLIVTILFGVWLLNYIFGIQIESFALELQIMVAGAVATAIVTIYVNTLTVMRRLKGQYYILLGTNALLTLTAAVVVERFAMMGGVVLFAAVSVLQALLLTCVYVRARKISV